MNKELIINSGASEVDIALLEEKQLVELHKEKNDTSFAVGDVYLGRVRKIMPGLNAAFVDVGYEKDAFLHYLDLGPQVQSLNKLTRLGLQGKLKGLTLDNFKQEKDIEKTGKITEVLAAGQQILVQVAKEPISTKGPRVSSELSFAGRFLVLVPFSNRISISQRIKSIDERKRLKRLILSIKPNNFGVIIRTVAEHKKVADLDNDLKSLVKKWEQLVKKMHNAQPPSKIVSEIDRTSVILRDVLNESFNSIIVNDQTLFDEIRNYLGSIAPEKTNIVKIYKGKKPVFENFGIDKQIKNSFGRIVTIRSGIYLIIEHTEALHVIDINSGHRVNKENSQEENALAVNLEAAAELARQLRLRDMGGIIVIDFIDMKQSHNRRKLYQKLRDEMAKDRAKHTILPPSKFGLVQITRQRVRPEMSVENAEKCPVCEGSGEIKPSIMFTDEIENNIRYLVQEQNEKFLKLSVHPYLYSYLKNGWPSPRMKWYRKYKIWVRLMEVNTYHLLEYHFFNKNDDQIKI
ncbi:MAG TPA: Rne/Rng family ribonuclease [Bacteroidales bacterium]|nr:Rne/Rng family ribonuclease [Bacteroidales bacterium]HRX97983.1 Rne/Rng family ribonuclease [Bacteroidales bacterium]